MVAFFRWEVDGETKRAGWFGGMWSGRSGEGGVRVHVKKLLGRSLSNLVAIIYPTSGNVDSIGSKEK